MAKTYTKCWACLQLPAGVLCPDCLELAKMENRAKYAAQKPAKFYGKRRNAALGDGGTQSAELKP